MSKAKLTELVETWGRLRKKVDAVNATADSQLDDLLVTFEKKAEPIYSERDRKLTPLIEEMNEIEATVRAEMLRGVGVDGSVALPQIEAANGALAQVQIEKKREIDPTAFFRAVPPRRRQEPGFMGCISVLVGKAEKFLDQATMSRLSRLKITPSVSFTLRAD